ncbi:MULTISPECIES: ATP-binding cassette domain-containing protein [Mammaliicoccus]|uniref:ATP-binding cassette domain-containing protein n=1 Tax=Mammaliicoccus TaxID=2803850 RepID=UPI00065B7C76|nr:MULTISPECIES: ATP-binding cassette domain-containing protein [Mammaliicoccus]MBO1219732.1 ATP-binding cassette domain-containing protein [Mammaliicoccus sciuri]MBO1232935.1 ATP-binding cassette domain-containing protein [Mammaliicoccus sciuri]PNY94395.1 multidrug ABC transporter ATP-binding protein [Mammaliicoccus sciuri]PTK03442.1 multidrug ABC transporter ATP-binding protein [Mammaliicoccus sciuri]QDR63494.1 ATP-binding cassette domain-containing protein [Mammaliicoccus sciuri]
MIKLVNVSKEHQRNLLLNNINLEIERGKVYGFKGRNGSGKTMLLRAILGLIKVEGQVIINNKPLKFGEKYPLKVGVFIEKPSIITEFTALKNLKLIAALKGITDINVMTKYLVELGLDYKDKRKVRKYSLGMKQKVGIAQTLMGEPELIVLDEPTNALDRKSIEKLVQILERLKQQGCTILIASHQFEDIESIVDEVVHIEAGALE